MYRVKYFSGLLVALLIIHSCKKKDGEDNVNPFDNPALQKPPANPDTVSLEPGSFAYLHYNVFKPTCSNSGCHDGNFEPDFRSMSSAYNTLVYHEVIQNDELGTYSYRVDPGNVANSFLYVRLTTNIPQNASGMMPLSVEPESDWVDKKAEYIEMIRVWIENGAKDPFGNSPGFGNPEPQVIGLLAFEKGNTTTPLPRKNQGQSPIRVPHNRDIDVWFAVKDDQTPAASLTNTSLSVSRSLSNFDGASKHALDNSSIISGTGFDGSSVTFTHKATLNFSTDTLGTFLYLRSYFQDTDHDTPVEIPNKGSNNLMKTRFSLQVDSL